MRSSVLAPCISVVIPVYNGEKTILRTLESVKKQTALLSILEVVIVDDGSKDKTVEFIKKFKEDNSQLNIQIISQKNSGVSSARNLGIQSSNGEWIALLDSDDEWIATKLEKQLNLIQKNPQIDFLGGNLYSKNLKILGKKTPRLYKANVRDLCVKMFPQTSTAIFKKKIFDDIGGYDETQKYAEDGKFFLNICHKYNYYHLNEQLVYFGDGKPEFGFSGLSANLKQMHLGNIRNIRGLKKRGIISKRFYYLLRLFYFAKYARRIVISNYAKWSSK